MKKVILSLAVSLGLVGMIPAVAMAAPGLKLDKKDISSKQCNPEDSHAKQIVNVHFKLINDYDSGFNSGAWANDTINRELRIFQLSDGTFCAQVKDNGKFVTLEGQSPGANDLPISAGIKGDIEGGYVTNFFTGTFAPQLPTKGDLGTYDLECTPTNDCPGGADRPSVFNVSYFSSTNGPTQPQWGWIYHAGKHGTWLNQNGVAAEDSGDITN